MFDFSFSVYLAVFNANLKFLETFSHGISELANLQQLMMIYMEQPSVRTVTCNLSREKVWLQTRYNQYHDIAPRRPVENKP